MKKAKDFQFEYLIHDDRGFSKYWNWSIKDEFDKVVCRLHNPVMKDMQGYLDIWHTAANGMLDKIGPLPWVTKNDLAYSELRIYIYTVIAERGIYSGVQFHDLADTLTVHLGNIDDGEVETEKGTRYLPNVTSVDGIEIKRSDAKTFREYRNFAVDEAKTVGPKQFKKFIRACELLGVESWYEVTGKEYEDRDHWNPFFFNIHAKYMWDSSAFKVRRKGKRAIVWVG